MKKAKAKLYRFFFAPALPYPLAAMRVGIAAVLLAQALSVSPVYFELYGTQGILQGAVAKVLSPGLPQVLELVAKMGIPESTALLGLAAIYVFSLSGLLVGFQTRAMAVLAWAAHLLYAEGHSTSYGADAFATVFLFYLIWVPSGEAFAVDAIGKAPVAKNTTRLALRLVQLQLAIAYFATGIGKAFTAQWWDGSAIWYSLMLPVYRQGLPVEWLANVPLLAMTAGWATLLIEVGYPLFIFLPATRRLWVALVLSLHLGIGVLLGLHVFAAIMMALSLSLFGVSAENAPAWERRTVPRPRLA